MRVVLILLGGLLLAGCGAKSSGPLSLYFLSSSRFTSGNRTSVGAGDTLATSLYALTNDQGNQVTHFRATVAYTPRREPFAYPTQLTLFINNVQADPEVTYLDTTLTGTDFLYTSVFGARTTTGTERWTFTAQDKDGNSSVRSFVLAVRRADSTNLYHDYTLRLRVPASGVSARRFLDLKSGLALPAYSVVGQVPSPSLQQLTDVIVLPDGLRLVSPDTLSATSSLLRLSDSRWPAGNRRSTRFQLTTLSPTDFTSARDSVAIQGQFTGPGRAYVQALALDQVYAFRTFRPDGVTPIYGLMRVLSVPNGTSAVGLQLQIRLAKRRRRAGEL
jgi:hypothetical protein